MHGSAPWSICPLVAPGVRSGNRCRGGDRLDAALAAGARDGLASGGGAAIRFSRTNKALTERDAPRSSCRVAEQRQTTARSPEEGSSRCVVSGGLVAGVLGIADCESGLR
jgi:hypothetical protein